MAETYIFQCDEDPNHVFYAECDSPYNSQESCVLCTKTAKPRKDSEGGPGGHYQFSAAGITRLKGKIPEPENIKLEDSYLLALLKPGNTGRITPSTVKDVFEDPTRNSSSREPVNAIDPPTTPDPPPAPDPTSAVEPPPPPRRGTTVKSVLVGVGGGGIGSLLLAQKSDADSSNRDNPGHKDFMPDELKPVIYDMSQEFRDYLPDAWERNVNFRFPMEFSAGAGRYPVFAEFPADLIFSRFAGEAAGQQSLFESRSQIVTIVHSVGGGTGSGTAPVFAKKIQQMALKSDADPQQAAAPFVISLSIVNTESDEQEKENHVYNLPRICPSFDLTIQIENIMCTGAGHPNRFDSFIEQKRRRATAERYLQGPILNSFSDGLLPEWFWKGNNDELLSVPDRYIARIWRLLHGTTEFGNLNNLMGTVKNGTRYSNPNGYGKHAVPYIWPLEKDNENFEEESDPTKYVVRALKDGGLTRVNISDFQTAESAVIIYNAKAKDAEFAGKMKRATAMILGIPEGRVVTIGQSSSPDGNVQSGSGMELLILAIGQIPTYVRELHGELQSNKDFLDRIKNLGKKWSAFDDMSETSNTAGRWKNLGAVASSYFNEFDPGVVDDRLDKWVKEIYEMDMLGPFLEFCDTNDIN